MNKSTEQNADSLAAAVLELLVLRASLPEDQLLEPDLVSVGTGSGPVAKVQAAATLARLPKPLTCSASVGPGGVLSVECSPIKNAADSGLHNSVIRGFDHQLRPALTERGENQRVLIVHGAGERLTVSVVAFMQWYRDYLPPTSVAFGSEELMDEEAGGGAVDRVITIHRVDPVDPADR